jgi:hypothetical protein
MVALKVLDAFEAAFDQIAEMPEIGHTREDLTLRPLKFWRVYSFLVVYEPTSDPLTVNHDCCPVWATASAVHPTWRRNCCHRQRAGQAFLPAGH